MSDKNELLISREARVFITYPSPNFDMDTLSNPGIPVLPQMTAGYINCVVKQGDDLRCKMIFCWPQVRDVLGVGVGHSLLFFRIVTIFNMFFW